MTIKRMIFTTSVAAAAAMMLTPAFLSGQAPASPRTGACTDPAASIRKPLADTWPTYSGDYTGRRYSALKQVNQTTVKNLTLAWTSRLTGGDPAAAAAAEGIRRTRRLRRRRASAPVIVGGEGTGEFSAGSGVQVKGAILQVDGILYVTAPDNVWAIDARDGRELWRYYWKTKGGTHIGNRGAAIWRNYLFFETPDNYLVSLDARTGKERWHVEIADFDQQYFSTMAPIVVDNHVLVGTGNDLDAPGFLQSYDPGDRQAQLDFLHRADEARRSRARYLAEPRYREARRRPGVDSRLLRSRDEVLHLRHRQPDAGLHGCRSQGRQPVHLHRSWPCTSTPARWPGTSRRRCTIRTTGIPRRRRSSSTPPSTASRGSSCRRRQETATSTPSIASPANIS